MSLPDYSDDLYYASSRLKSTYVKSRLLDCVVYVNKFRIGEDDEFNGDVQVYLAMEGELESTTVPFSDLDLSPIELGNMPFLSRKRSGTSRTIQHYSTGAFRHWRLGLCLENLLCVESNRATSPRISLGSVEWYDFCSGKKEYPKPSREVVETWEKIIPVSKDFSMHGNLLVYKERVVVGKWEYSAMADMYFPKLDKDLQFLSPVLNKQTIFKEVA